MPDFVRVLKSLINTQDLPAKDPPVTLLFAIQL